MAQQMLELDGIFQALADPTRRAVIKRLGAGPASIGELAAPFDMALPSFMKHIRSLENSGWITTQKVGRVRTCELRSEHFEVLEDWLTENRRLWEDRTDRLEQFVTGKDPHDEHDYHDQLDQHDQHDQHDQQEQYDQEDHA